MHGAATGHARHKVVPAQCDLASIAEPRHQRNSVRLNPWNERRVSMLIHNFEQDLEVVDVMLIYKALKPGGFILGLQGLGERSFFFFLNHAK